MQPRFRLDRKISVFLYWVLLSVFLAHADADAPFAQELGTFLEIGCDAIYFVPDAAIKPGHDLISAVESGHSADILVLLLSAASNPPRWPCEMWKPLLSPRTSEADTRIAIFLLEECPFPPLLRRGLKFFDATVERLPSMRQLKRWLWSIRLGTHPGMAFSSDMEILYRVLANKPRGYSAPPERWPTVSPIKPR
jgi:hypothetical protein